MLVDVNESMSVMREETFGPVIPLARVTDEAEAVTAVNSSPYGLLASVWTSDRQRARRIASLLRVGGVTINDCLVNFGIPDLPFGGIGESGYGRQGGPEGLRQFCYLQSLTEPRLSLRREPYWLPRLFPSGAVRAILKLRSLG